MALGFCIEEITVLKNIDSVFRVDNRFVNSHASIKFKTVIEISGIELISEFSLSFKISSIEKCHIAEEATAHVLIYLT